MAISKTVLNNIAKMSEAELLDLNELVVSRIKSMRAVKKASKAAAFNVGDKVRFDAGRRGGFINGTVTKVNKVNIKVNAGVLGNWNVSANLLEKM